MGPDQLRHAGKPEVVVWSRSGIHRRAEPLLVMPAMDPTRRKSETVGRLEIVEHAFSGMQYLVLANAVPAEIFQHVLEISW